MSALARRKIAEIRGTSVRPCGSGRRRVRSADAGEAISMNHILKYTIKIVNTLKLWHRCIICEMATRRRNHGAVFQQLPLRERKLARLRLRVLDAVLALTAKRPLADVSVREICELAEISQGTFF